MSTEPKLSHAAEDLLSDVTRYVESSEDERRQLRGELANVRALLKTADADKAELATQLAAAEKRAEEALDTARRELAEARAEIARAAREIESALAERNAAREDAEDAEAAEAKMRAERDEAREKAKLDEQALDEAVQRAAAEVARVEAERDAAQAVAKETGHQLGEAGAARLQAECERDVAQKESAGRLKVIEEKSEEARREWKRAENAEAERDAAREEAERLRAQIEQMKQANNGTGGGTK